MKDNPQSEGESLRIAECWCKSKGQEWSVCGFLGIGGTAPVFEVLTPDGPRALKIYDLPFSSGKKGAIEYKRIEQQLELKGHDCPYLVKIFDGGHVEGRLFLLMERAPGIELEKKLSEVPRGKIRQIVDQIARAVIFLRERGLCHRDIKAANIFVSADFDHCTLLDISVIRNVTDPIGIGTDHDGQLPIVATARYSPPEYLFRLLQPTPELWHALNVYQLGSLLHDLIMRKPLFEAEYLESMENRYRFAWIVATVTPNVQADDVDQDLLFLARRALDKDWQRRSALRLDDFLDDSAIHKANALQVLGFLHQESFQRGESLTARHRRISEVADILNTTFTDYLRSNGITAYHEVRPGSDDTTKLVVFQWNVADESGNQQSIGYQAELHLLLQGSSQRFGTSIKLEMHLASQVRVASMVLPELDDDVDLHRTLSSYAENALGQLAMNIMRSNDSEEE
jgi:serine/threonine protein kinase